MRDLLLDVALTRCGAPPRPWPPPSERRTPTRASARACALARALATWGDAGGCDAEVLWDECCTTPCARPLTAARRRPPAATFSGGEQKRLALEVLLRRDADVLLLDEPDNFLDVPAKRWLEGELSAARKTVLLRQPRPRAAGRDGDEDRHDRGGTARGRTAARSPSYARGPRGAARPASTRTTALRRGAQAARGLVVEMRRRASMGSDDFAPRRARDQEPKIERFDAATAHRSRCASSRSRCASAATAPASGRRSCEQLELHGLTDPFDVEVVLRRARRRARPQRRRQEPLPAPARRRAPSRHDGQLAPRRRRRAGLVPPDPRPPRAGAASTLLDDPPRRATSVRGHGDGGAAPLRAATAAPSSRSRRCRAASRPASRSCCSSCPGATLLLLDEPTDNLDLVSAEALEDGARSRSTARSSPSPTTAGSCAASTASSCSAATPGHRAPRTGVRLTQTCEAPRMLSRGRPPRLTERPRSMPPRRCSTCSTRGRRGRRRTGGCRARRSTP